MDEKEEKELDRLLARPKERFTIVDSAPWNTYAAYRTGKLLTPEELIEIVKSDRNCRNNPMNAAYISVMYLFGLRIGEVSRYIYHAKIQQYMKDGVALKLPSMKVKDFWGLIDSNGKRWLCARVRRQKATKIKNKIVNDLKVNDYQKFIKLKQKSIFPRFDNVKVLYSLTDTFFIDLLEKWIDKLYDFKKDSIWNGERELFPFSRCRGEVIISNCFGFSPHTIRNIRADHLTKYYNFSATDLQKFFGWSSPTQALKYVNSNDFVLEQRFLQREKNVEIEQQFYQ